MVEEFSGGVALTEEILPSQRQFFPTFYEWLLLKGQPFLKEFVENNSASAYSLGNTNKVMYITHIIISWSNEAGTGSTGAGYVRVKGKFKWATPTPAQKVHSNVVIPFNPPLKVDGEEQIDIYSLVTNFYLTCEIMGFIVDKKVI